MPHYTLYGFNNSASTSIHWILAELAPLGATYDIVDINLRAGEQKAASYLALNAKGRVPTLTFDNGKPVTETGAIAALLAEAYPAAKLAITSAEGFDAHAFYLETLVYVLNSHLPAMRDWMYAGKDGAEKYAHGVRLFTLPRLKANFEFFDKQLAKTQFIAGDRPTIADFIFAPTVTWAKGLDVIAVRYPNLKAYLARMRARDSWKAVLAREGVDPQLADWEKPYLEL
ncbi:Glutathione S-transferase GST-60 [Vanrija pseudolonga]|uniref:Glutathione S-transferase GST-60 n=1 Tax=Vanrija pseudolonga TaxID=143232 RepID=A0AAF0Y023_9TREE|nr:Glutathione S-transferase GST-60 [Vanrija pseudolonga]